MPLFHAHPRPWTQWAVALCGVALTGPAVAQTPPRAGAEFQVNETTRNLQNRPTVAMDADGDIVVVWESAEQDGDQGGIYARRYSRSGLPTSSEFRVHTMTVGDQRSPRVGMDALGNFVVVWTSAPEGPGTSDIHAQRFAADGTPLGSEFVVNGGTTGEQRDAAVAVAPDGSFVVVWSTFLFLTEDPADDAVRIQARRFLADGTPAGAEWRVNTSTVGFTLLPAVAVQPSGEVLIAWQTFFGVLDTSKSGIFYRRFTPSNTPLSEDLDANVNTENRQSNASVALDAQGRFVIVWQSKKQDGGIGLGGGGVFGRRFDADGRPLTDEFQLNEFSIGGQRLPQIAMNTGGSFVVTWESETEDGSYFGVYARRFTPQGRPSGGQFAVNTYTEGDQRAPSVALAEDGHFVVTWESGPPMEAPSLLAQDGDRSGIFAQRFLGTVAAEETPTAEAAPAVSVFPIPAQGAFSVSFTLDRPENARLEVFDVWGRRVRMLRAGTVPAGPHTWSFAAQELAPGYYVLRLLTETTQNSTPLILR